MLTDERILGHLIIGDIYYVHPETSFKFGGRAGTLAVVDKSSRLPYGLIFEGHNIPYYFSRDELLTPKEFHPLQTGLI